MVELHLTRAEQEQVELTYDIGYEVLSGLEELEEWVKRQEEGDGEPS